jgi:hypothetical protein
VVTGTWTDSSELTPRPWQGDHQAAEVYDGKLCVLGALGSGAGTVQIYDPASNTWRQGALMPTQRHGIFPLLYEARIYVAGGAEEAGVASSTAHDIYTP